MLFDFILFLFWFSISLSLTCLMVSYAKRKCLMDVPNERSSHVVPTPRGGGLAVVVVFLVGLSASCIQGKISLENCLALVGSGSLVAAVGFWDDHRHISVRSRILVHFLAAGWAFFWIRGFPEIAAGISFSIVVQNVFWLVVIVWILNAYNFMDGIDGIAGAEAVFVAGASGLLLWLKGDASHLTSVSVLIMAGTAGFLFWNIPKARIFMGDVGSGFLGVVFGVQAVISIQRGELTLWVWAILLGVFFSDATITVLRRILRGVCWHTAHRNHAYQHAVRKLKNHGKVTLVVTCINVLWLFPLSVAAYHRPGLGALFVLCAYLPLVWLAFRLRAGLDD